MQAPAFQMPVMAAVPMPTPHSFFLVAILATIFCGILNILSLAFGIPAIILAGMVSHDQVERTAALYTCNAACACACNTKVYCIYMACCHASRIYWYTITIATGITTYIVEGDRGSL